MCNGVEERVSSQAASQDAGIRRFQCALEGEHHGFQVQRGAV